MTEDTVRAIAEAAYGAPLDEWEIVNCGAITVYQPPVEVTSDGRIGGGADSCHHYIPGDDRYITIGTIHLKRRGK